MAGNNETLRIILSVLLKGRTLLQKLKKDLAEIETLEKAVGDIRIKVHVDDDQLDRFIAKMWGAKVNDELSFNTRGRGGGMGGMGGLTNTLSQIETSFSESDQLDKLIKLQKGNNRMLAKMTRGRGMRVGGGFYGGDGDGQGPSKFRRLLQRFVNPRMSDFHNTLAALIPLIINIIMALPAVITGLVALAAAAIAAAGALLAIGGLAFLAVAAQGGGRPNMERIQEMLLNLVDSIWRAIQPLTRRFEALGFSMMDGVERLFTQITRVAGPALAMLEDDARAFGQFLMMFIPGAIRNMALMAEAFRPVFSMVGDFFENNSFLMGLTRMFADMLPTFARFTGLIVALTPGLIDLSIGFLESLNAIMMLVAGFFKLIGVFGLSGEAVGFLIGLLFTLWTIVGLLNNQLLIMALRSLIQFAVSIGASMAATYGLNVALTQTLVLLTLITGGLLLVVGAAALASGAVMKLGNSVMGMNSEMSDAVKHMRSMDGMSVSGTASTQQYGPDPRTQTIKGRYGSGGNMNVTVNNNSKNEKNNMDKTLNSIGFLTRRPIV